MRRVVLLSSVIVMARLQNAMAGDAAHGWPSPPARGTGEAVKLTDEMMSKVKSAISDSRATPAAIRIGERIVAVRTDSGIHVCGTVSIKSSSSAFAGEKPFYAMGNRAGAAFALIRIGGSQRQDKLVRLLCSVHGIK